MAETRVRIRGVILILLSGTHLPGAHFQHGHVAPGYAVCPRTTLSGAHLRRVHVFMKVRTSGVATSSARPASPRLQSSQFPIRHNIFPLKDRARCRLGFPESRGDNAILLLELCHHGVQFFFNSIFFFCFVRVCKSFSDLACAAHANNRKKCIFVLFFYEIQVLTAGVRSWNVLHAVQEFLLTN